MIVDNDAASYGGGFHVGGDVTVNASHLTLVNNTAVTQGDAINMSGVGGNTLNVTNSIFWDFFINKIKLNLSNVKIFCKIDKICK